MRGGTLVPPLAAALVLAACASVGPIADTRTVTLRDGEGRTVGTAMLAPERDGVRVVVSTHGVAPGVHGVHIHEHGRCDGPGFETAGGHFNPGGMRHGLQNPAGPHSGDLPNLVVRDDGRGVLTAVARGVAIRGRDPDSLLRPGGTSLVVHASPDDGITDPSGNSGVRIACAVIAPDG
jgi:superoxide dismutase, Cu-Zn family